MDCLHQVLTQRKEVVDGAVDREKALKLAQRLETTHLAFPLPNRLLSAFCPCTVA